MSKLHSTLVDGLGRKNSESGGKWRFFLNAKAPFQDSFMRCRTSRGNDLRSTRRSSPRAIWQKKRHISPYVCVRNRTATTAKCLEVLRLEHSDHRRPQQYGRQRPRTHNASDFDTSRRAPRSRKQGRAGRYLEPRPAEIPTRRVSKG
jgi:hypothetical protein